MSNDLTRSRESVILTGIRTGLRSWTWCSQSEGYLIADLIGNVVSCVSRLPGQKGSIISMIPSNRAETRTGIGDCTGELQETGDSKDGVDRSNECSMVNILLSSPHSRLYSFFSFSVFFLQPCPFTRIAWFVKKIPSTSTREIRANLLFSACMCVFIRPPNFV